MLKGGCSVMVSIPMTGARISSDSRRGRPPRLLIISISHQLQRSAAGGCYDDAAGTDPTSWDGEVNGATSNLKYWLGNMIN